MMTVTQTIQAPDNEPVQFNLITNPTDSGARILSAVASAIDLHEQSRTHPVLHRVDTLSITITFGA